ncbi:MAG: hypothetical protein LBV50_12195 [Novosphingobium sp.]|nr:hypothetical protein [Novosphingobium sp.]
MSARRFISPVLAAFLLAQAQPCLAQAVSASANTATLEVSATSSETCGFFGQSTTAANLTGGGLPHLGRLDFGTHAAGDTVTAPVTMSFTVVCNTSQPNIGFALSEGLHPTCWDDPLNPTPAAPNSCFDQTWAMQNESNSNARIPYTIGIKSGSFLDVPPGSSVEGESIVTINPQPVGEMTCQLNTGRPIAIPAGEPIDVTLIARLFHQTLDAGLPGGVYSDTVTIGLCVI